MDKIKFDSENKNIIITTTEDCTEVDPVEEGGIMFTGFENVFGKKDITKKKTTTVINLETGVSYATKSYY